MLFTFQRILHISNINKRDVTDKINKYLNIVKMPICIFLCLLGRQDTNTVMAISVMYLAAGYVSYFIKTDIKDFN